MKRNCKKGYSCGKSCISLRKACRKEFPEGVAVQLDSMVPFIADNSPKELPPKSPQGFSSKNHNFLGRGKSEPYSTLKPTLANRLGVSDSEANQMIYAVGGFTKSNYRAIREIDAGTRQPDDFYGPQHKDLYKYLRNPRVPIFKGSIYRGLNGLSADQIKNLVPGGMINLDAISSFSSSKNVAKKYSKADGGKGAVLLKVNSNATGKSVKSLSVYPEENEVVVPKGSSYQIRSVTKVGGITEVTVDEV